MAARERQALAAALEGVEPEAPTLCQGWQARDLAEHIVLRDRRPDALLSEDLPVLGSWVRWRRSSASKLTYRQLISQVAEGPGPLAPSNQRFLNDLMNSAEFFIHTEDVLRAQPDYQPEQKRPIAEALRRRLWNQSTRTFFPMAARKHGLRLTFVAPGYKPVTVGRAADKQAKIEGDAEDLVLWVSGREAAAHVRLSSE